VEGASRFLKRLWKLVYEHLQHDIAEVDAAALSDAQKALRRKTHQTLKKVSDDIGRRYTFNTAIAAVMELMNELAKFDISDAGNNAVMCEAIELVLLMLSPIVPHITQQLWQETGHEGLIADAAWPQVDEDALVQDEIELVVQVNGKLRSKIRVPAGADKARIEQTALQDAKIQNNLQDKTVRKVIVVPGRLVNIVAA